MVKRSQKILLIGVASGDSLIALGTATLVTGGCVIALDEKEKAKLVPHDYGNWVFHRTKTIEFLKKNKERFDLVVIEYPHSYKETLLILKELSSHLKTPATIIVNRTEVQEVSLALHDFNLENGCLLKKTKVSYGTVQHESAYQREMGILYLENNHPLPK